MNKPKYPGKYPQEPYEPVKPNINDFIGTSAKRGKYLYSDTEMLKEDIDEDEYWEDMDEKKPNVPNKRYFEKLSLQDILDLAPEGIKPKDIVFDLNYPRYLDYIQVGFYILKRDLDAEKAAYELACSKYEEQYEKYKVEHAEYLQNKLDFENWKNQQEILELENKLNKLKNK